MDRHRLAYHRACRSPGQQARLHSRRRIQSQFNSLSTTSTGMFSHKALRYLPSKVLKLCKQKGRNLPKNAFTITRIGGGSYNRIIGIHVDESKRKKSWHQRLLRTKRTQMLQGPDYIHRIPRFDHAWLEHEIAMLNYLEHTGIPAPSVQTWSLSRRTPLRAGTASKRAFPVSQSRKPG